MESVEIREFQRGTSYKFWIVSGRGTFEARDRLREILTNEEEYKQFQLRA